MWRTTHEAGHDHTRGDTPHGLDRVGGSAREVAAIVLPDDNFRTIVRAIGEGRQLFANLRTSFQYLLIIHAPFVVSALAIPLLGYPLLYLPVHIVWVELIIHPSALLVFQELPAGPLQQQAAPQRAVLFHRRDWIKIAAVGAIVATTVVLAYVRSASEPGGTEHGRAAALATLALASGFITAVLSRLRTRAAWLVSAATIASAIVLVQTAPLARLLHLEPLHAGDWALAVGGGLLALVPLGLGSVGGSSASSDVGGATLDWILPHGRYNSVGEGAHRDSASLRPSEPEDR